MIGRKRAVTAIVLAFVLGAGVAAAASAGAAGLITGRQIKDGSVGLRDLSPAVLRQLRRTGAPGPQGPHGSQGPKGDPGPLIEPQGWVPIAFGNGDGWRPFPADGHGVPAYRKDPWGDVHLRGLACPATFYIATGQTLCDTRDFSYGGPLPFSHPYRRILTLDPGFRPGSIEVLHAVAADGTNSDVSVRIDVHPDGRVVMAADRPSIKWVSLSGLSFHAMQ